METNYLRTFMVVLESGSMSEAARRLDLTPAAVAQQMRVLERDLAARTDRVFEIEGKRVGIAAQGLVEQFGSRPGNEEFAAHGRQCGAGERIEKALESSIR